MDLAQNGAESAVIPSQRLFLVHYDDHPVDLRQLMQTISIEGKTGIVWNLARGFMLNHHSKRYALSDNRSDSGLSDPKEAIRFIINKAQNEVYYVLEDFHHLETKR